MTHQTSPPLFDDREIRLPLALCILALIVSAFTCTPGRHRTAVARETGDAHRVATITTTEDHIDDAILHFEAKARLLDALGWAAIGIDVDAMDGRVVLSGDVPERSDRELAAEIVRAVEGVEHVENRLVLEGEPATRVATGPRMISQATETEDEVLDALLEARLKARLLEEIGRHALDVRVEAADGVVTLRGEVGNEAHERIALEAASHTEGVKRVINLLQA